MHLSLAFLLIVSSVAKVAADLRDGDPGVCHITKPFTFTEYEEREREETRTEWCLEITQGFRCEVVYTVVETVPVTKERDEDVLACCEGYLQFGNECERHSEVKTDTEEPEYVKLQVNRAEEEVTEDERTNEEPENAKQQSNQSDEEAHTGEEMDTSQEEDATVAASDEATSIDPDDNLRMDDLELANELFKHKLEETHAFPPSTVDPAIENSLNDHDSAGHNAVPLSHDVLGILAKELVKSLTKESSSDAPEASTEAAAATAVANSHVVVYRSKVKGQDGQGSAPSDSADEVGAFAHELHDSLEHSTAAPEAALIDTEPAAKGDNAEMKAADALSIFWKELLKSHEQSTAPPAPSSDSAEQVGHGANAEQPAPPHSDALSIFWKDLLKSIEQSTEATVASSIDSAEPPHIDSERAENEANAEAMAADALSIFVHELLKSLMHRTETPAPAIGPAGDGINYEADAPSHTDSDEWMNTIDHHTSFEADEPVAIITETTEEALWRAQAVLLQTMEEIHEILLHSLSLLHHVSSSLHPLAPRRDSLE